MLIVTVPDHKMPLYQTKTIANILEPVAQQVNCQHTEGVAKLSPVSIRNYYRNISPLVAMFPVLSQYPPSDLPVTS